MKKIKEQLAAMGYNGITEGQIKAAQRKRGGSLTNELHRLEIVDYLTRNARWIAEVQKERLERSLKNAA